MAWASPKPLVMSQSWQRGRMCVNIQSQVWVSVWRTGVHYERRAGVALDVIWTLVGWLCFFFFSHLQFQNNNNNYMNMAEANGALLAAGDVSKSAFYHVNVLFWRWKTQYDQHTLNTNAVEDSGVFTGACMSLHDTPFFDISLWFRFPYLRKRNREKSATVAASI